MDDYEPQAVLKLMPGERLELQMYAYDAFGTRADGSTWACHRRRLADGSWFEVRHWGPPAR